MAGTAGAALLGLFVALWIILPAGGGGQVARPRPVSAQELRQDAAEACGMQQWAACARKLDDARALDPDGEELPEVQDLRQELQLHPEANDPPR